MIRLFDSPALIARGLRLRAACVADSAFERVLFETARTDIALLTAAFPAEARRTFLDQQFHFQTIHYARAYPDAARQIVLAADIPIGRMILNCAPSGWCLVDIALLPAWRGRGLGSLLLQGVLDAAARAGAPRVSLSVELTNPARRLYRRLSFVVVAEAVPHAAMEWRPPPAHQLKTA